MEKRVADQILRCSGWGGEVGGGEGGGGGGVSSHAPEPQIMTV